MSKIIFSLYACTFFLLFFNQLKFKIFVVSLELQNFCDKFNICGRWWHLYVFVVCITICAYILCDQIFSRRSIRAVFILKTDIKAQKLVKLNTVTFRILNIIFHSYCPKVFAIIVRTRRRCDNFVKIPKYLTLTLNNTLYRHLTVLEYRLLRKETSYFVFIRENEILWHGISRS